MSELQETHSSSYLFLLFSFILLSGSVVVVGDSLDTDKQILLRLKKYLDNKTLADRGKYIYWNSDGSDSSPCEWQGILCSEEKRVISVDLSSSDITGEIFQSFSELTQLTHLDLSQNTLFGNIPEDLRNCRKLLHLNLSHNILEGELNVTGLRNLITLDLSLNRFHGQIGLLDFPSICENLVTLNISGNNLTGEIGDSFDKCLSLKYLDLSTNKLSGGIWNGFARLKQFSVAENLLNGNVSSEAFPLSCELVELDLSQNGFVGEAPKQISNCKNLTMLNLSSNNFTGAIPVEIGSISLLKGLYLGGNNFSRDVPETLLKLSNLVFLDFSRNNFGGDIQKIFGNFTQVRFLLLHSNSYTGGLLSSGIFTLPNITRLDLSFNGFSGPLPVEISHMQSLELLMLSYNQFNGTIPSEFGNMHNLQALDLAFNRLSGPIPPSLGNLTSLLWLMLADNSLNGTIPSELGNCSSLLWLNLANNNLTGTFPREISKIGKNAMETFEFNRRKDGMVAGSGECLAMRRWIPADYPPFSFVYDILTRKNCRGLWNKLLKGYGIFPFCTPGSSLRLPLISGYVQLSGNKLSGEIPSEIGTMVNFSLLHMGFNRFSGKLPPELGNIPLVVLNLTTNNFSGEIPTEIGNFICLQNLDLSRNNFSGNFPSSLNKVSELNKFNISYNPFIQVPRETIKTWLTTKTIKSLQNFKTPSDQYLLRDHAKHCNDSSSSGIEFQQWLSDSVKVIRLNKTAFTYADILKATNTFSENRIIGRGGFGTVYKGFFSDGREVAVKKLLSEGREGEKEFQAEMEVLSGHGFGWPHPNLVTLYGWCLNNSEKILVYEYIEGGSLEDLVTDKTRLTWKKRLQIAIDVARALVYLHHECDPSIVHRDVKASNVLLDKEGKAKVTDFGLARVVNVGDSHVSTMVAGTIGYVAPEYGQTMKATTKGDVYSYGVLAMELATGRRAVDGDEECLVEWTRRVMMGRKQQQYHHLLSYLGSEEMVELLCIGLKCTNEAANGRPNMKQVLAMLILISKSNVGDSSDHGHII
ncbi:unnamed protein product [Vicia faba]|uniref:non-specific serine/threonine protein kinase n=1 Tax=Vicia faba TaxID=3906 RepID=A0AAV0YCC9_VICFA|nr:unnamed protein product [Vicia faba]